MIVETLGECQKQDTYGICSDSGNTAVDMVLGWTSEK